jgi:hypothetical protein
MMAEFHVDMRDVRFALFDHAGIEALFSREPYREQSRADYELMLQEAEKLAREVLFPLNEVGDREGARWENGKVFLPTGFRAAFEKFAEGGWIALNQKPDDGGMGLPYGLTAAITELFTAANTAFMMAPGLAVAASRVIAMFATKEMADKCVVRMNTGVWGGTMCLTEPQAGSAVGDARTIATPLGNGVYSVVGNKIFISMGKQDVTENIIHLVLARTPGAPSGTRGLSLFIVPEYRINEDGSNGDFNDVHCARIEEKMGIHASPTCVMNFGDNNDCHGYLIGEEGRGIQYMFHMMNEARLAVGIQGAAAANLAYLTSVAYANERVQGSSVRNFRDPDAPRVRIIEHPNVRTALMEARAYAEGCRALVYRTAVWADRAETATDDKERQEFQGLVEVFTPIIKAYCSDAGLRATDLAMQTHGGYGYIREYAVEQYMRDVKIAAIYEGTNSIQAMDLLARKVARKNGQDFRTVVQYIDRFTREHKDHPTQASSVKALDAAKNTLVQATLSMAQYQLKADYEYPVLHCDNYLRMFGHVVLSWMLTEQAVLAHKKAQDLLAEDPTRTPESHPDLRYYEDKGRTARYFASQILPDVQAIFARMQSANTDALTAHF